MQEAFADGPTSGCWSTLFSVGATGVFRVLRTLTGSISRFLYLECSQSFRGSALRVLPPLQVFRGSILRVSYPCLGFCTVLLILPVLAVFGLSVLPILPVLVVYRPPVPQHSQYPENKTWSMLRVYSEFQVYWAHLRKVYYVDTYMRGSPRVPSL